MHHGGAGSARKAAMLHHELTDHILGALVAVHTALGPGLPERSYQNAAALEFRALGIAFEKEPKYEVRYRSIIAGYHKPDFVVDGKVVLELKCVSGFAPVFTAQ